MHILKKDWTMISRKRYVQSSDSDYLITCSDTSVKATLRFKVIMENPLAMRYFKKR